MRVIARPARAQPGRRARPAATAVSSTLLPLELPQRSDLAGRLFLTALRRPRHLRHVEVAPRVDGAAMRGHELARLLPGEAAADPAEQLALEIENAHARTEIGDVLVDRQMRRQLADKEDI